MTYDFDRVIDRRRTESNKWHKYAADVLPHWVADMDFPSPEPVIRALRERVEHGVFGYGIEHKARVALNDGKTFGRGGAGFARLNFACPRVILTEALDRMRHALERRT